MLPAFWFFMVKYMSMFFNIKLKTLCLKNWRYASGVGLFAILVFVILLLNLSQASVNYPVVEVNQHKELQRPVDINHAYRYLTDKIMLQADLAGQIHPVAEIFSDNAILIKDNSTLLEVPFGYDYAFIGSDKSDKIRTESDLNDNIISHLKTSKEINWIAFETPKTNELFITKNKVNIYQEASTDAKVFAVLYPKLRYPINAKLVDKNGHYWYEVLLAGHVVYVDSKDVEIDKGIGVLTYHHILEDAENKYFRNTSTTISAEAFRSQLTHLKAQGYKTITLDDLYLFLNKKKNLPSNVFVITFDDGLKSVYRYGYPVLKSLDYDATVFMITSRIKRKSMNWDPNSLQFMSIEEMKDAKSVFNYQSHSHFLHKLHNKKPIIFQRSAHVIEYDIERSLRALKYFNRKVAYFAYPFGAYDQKSIDAIKQAGISMAFSTVRGKVKPGDNLLKLKRLYFLTKDDLKIVEKKVAN